MPEVKGYKAFNIDFTCRGFQYEIGQTYIEERPLKRCSTGFHFCRKLSDCFAHYPYDRTKTRIAEVTAKGEVIEDKGGKCVTNQIEIDRELSWDQVQRLVNIGKDCTGINNTGDRNSGYGNSGDGNSGCRNSGNGNSGYGNSGYGNSGHGNSGYQNSGDGNSGYGNSGYGNSGYQNTGYYNQGNHNTGNHNTANRCTGDFNSKNISCLSLFNIPITEQEFKEWRKSDLCRYFNSVPVLFRKQKRTYVLAPLQSAYRLWWDNLSDEIKREIKTIPNFDPEVFREITSIDINSKGKSRGIPN